MPLIKPEDVAFIVDNPDGTSTVGVHTLVNTDVKSRITGMITGKATSTKIERVSMPRQEANVLAQAVKKQREMIDKYERENGGGQQTSAEQRRFT